MKPGDTFGRLTVMKLVAGKNGGKTRALVKCSCGKRKVVQRGNLSSGHTTSCGCFHSQRMREVHTVHGHNTDAGRSATYQVWRTMVNNCTNPTAGSFHNYGARGIDVCARWRGEHGFEHFLEDMGERPGDGHVLSRKNKLRDFTPANTIWATRHDAARNKRTNTMYTVGSETMCLVDWAVKYNIPKTTLHYRVVTKGMTMRDALDLGRGTRGRPLPE